MSMSITSLAAGYRSSSIYGDGSWAMRAQEPEHLTFSSTLAHQEQATRPDITAAYGALLFLHRLV